MTVDDLHPPSSTLELSLYVTHQPIHHYFAECAAYSNDNEFDFYQGP